MRMISGWLPAAIFLQDLQTPHESIVIKLNSPDELTGSWPDRSSALNPGLSP